MGEVRITVVGAGVMGRRHAHEVDANSSTMLASIVDTGRSGPDLAASLDVPLYRSLAELFEHDKPDGVILATPNRAHADGGLECVAAGVPVIVEKPIADTVDSATRLVEAGERAGVPVLTGHHRNYSAIMAKAREIMRSGRLGRIVAVAGTALFHKHSDYFDLGGGWRRHPGGGPILINLIHDVKTCSHSSATSSKCRPPPPTPSADTR
jgi:predicted dehydrogenase